MTVALCVLLAGSFATAAVAKLRDRRGLRATLRTLGAPAWLEFAVPAVELGLAAALLAGAGRVAAACAFALLAAFSAVLGRLGTVPCRCFGAGSDGDPRSGQVRNALLGVAAAALVVWPAAAVWAVPVREMLGAATVAAGLSCVWLLARAQRAVTA